MLPTSINSHVFTYRDIQHLVGYQVRIEQKKLLDSKSLSKSGHKMNMRGHMIRPKKKLLFILWEVLTYSSIKMNEDKTYTDLFMTGMSPWKVGWVEVQMLCINHLFHMVNEVQRLKLQYLHYANIYLFIYLVWVVLDLGNKQ